MSGDIWPMAFIGFIEVTCLEQPFFHLNPNTGLMNMYLRLT